MNGKAPAVGQPDMEVKKFTAAEFKALQTKMQKYQEAANVVNEWLSFLKEQYGVNDGEGWQLGEGCFVRPVRAVEGEPEPVAEKPVAEKPVAARPKRNRPARALKTGKDYEDVLEHVGVGSENGRV